jgi:hypothetical protein
MDIGEFDKFARGVITWHISGLIRELEKSWGKTVHIAVVAIPIENVDLTAGAVVMDTMGGREGMMLSDIYAQQAAMFLDGKEDFTVSKGH